MAAMLLATDKLWTHPTNAISINKINQNTVVDIFFNIYPFTMKFCTYQDSRAVLVCAKFHGDWISHQ